MKTTKKLAHALKKGDLASARDLVTLLEPGKTKSKYYRNIYTRALSLGRLDVAMEIAPFSGTTITEQDYRTCADNAYKYGDWNSFIACKDGLGEPIRHQAFDRFIDHATGPLKVRLISLFETKIEGAHVRELCVLMRKSQLTAEDEFVMRLIEAGYSRR